VQCAESLRLHAYFDGQLDATSAHSMEQHLPHCPACRDLLCDVQMLRHELRENMRIERAPADLRARVRAAVEREGETGNFKPRDLPNRWSRRAFWSGALSGLGGAAAAATLAWIMIVRTWSSVLVSDVVNAHVHSLLPDHLIAVVSTDRHTVKPWFAGHADVSPVVADFEKEGYKLIGGRADILRGQRAAVVVYRHGAHTVNVFSWVSELPAATEYATSSGYHLVFWKVGNLQYCSVSDTGWDELQALVRLLRELAMQEDHPA
jgi:anti-sigma factor RsiW